MRLVEEIEYKIPPLSVSLNAYMDGLKFFFFPRVIATWNGLTTEAVSAETIDGFKSKI